MQIAIRRGELIEKAVVMQQAAFLLAALRGRCMSAPSAWSRRLVGIDHPRQMNERLREMMTERLEEISNLPEKVSTPGWIGEENAERIPPFADDDGDR